MADTDNNHLKNIVVVGASGNVGASVLKHLLSTNRFNITIISRTDSKATFPSHPSISVKRGSYDDPAFLSFAFSGEDAIIFALGFLATGEQPKLISAAAKVGVRWIIPNEYAGDGTNKAMMDAVLMFWPKREVRKQIEDLAAEGKDVKWIGIATNPWTEFSMQMGMFGINIHERRVTLYDDAGSFNTSTLEQVGKGIAALLSLPISNPSNTRASLEHYANNFVYVSSFLTTQRELFEAIRRATGTTSADWTIEKSSIFGPGGKIEVAEEGVRKGDMIASGGLTYAYYMGEGLGGNYEEKAREDRKVLDLQEDNLDVLMREVVRMPKPVPLT